MAATLVAVAAGTLPGASASSDSRVVVHGTALPLGNRAQLTAVGCTDIFQRGAGSLRPAVVPGGGPTGTPADTRSLGFAATSGTAAGLVSYADAIAATTVAGVSVRAEAGTTGVAYVGYQAPADQGTSRMWIGRLPLTAPASGAWAPYDVTGLGFAWTQYDMSTGRSIGGVVGTSGVPAFVRAMGGDGYGFYAIGFGCDGNDFSLDAWRIGRDDATTTYDFEGYAASVTGGAPATIAPGESLTLSASASVTGGPAPRVVLEAKHADGEWGEVATRSGAHPSVVVRPAATTTYRWKVYSTALVEGATSEEFTVTVQRPSDPAEEPTREPGEHPTAPAGDPTTPAGDPTAPAPSDTAAPAPAQQQPQPAAPATSAAQPEAPPATSEAAPPPPPETSAPAVPEQTAAPEKAPEQATSDAAVAESPAG